MSKSGSFECITIDNKRFYSFMPKSLQDIMRDYSPSNATIRLLTNVHRNIGVLNGLVQANGFMDGIIKNLCYCDIYNAACLDKFKLILHEVISENSHNLGYIYNAFHGIQSDELTINIDEILNLHKSIFNSDKEGVRSEFITDSYSINVQEGKYPNPHLIIHLLHFLDKYIAENTEQDILIKLAMIYYQFDRITPFETGGNVVFSVLLNRLLRSSDIIVKPVFYIFEALYNHKKELENCFSDVIYFSEIERYIRFFLEQSLSSTNQTIEKINMIIELRNKNLNEMDSISGISKYSNKVIIAIEDKPIFQIKELADSVNISFNTANKIVRYLVKKKILIEISGQERYKLYEYSGYVDIIAR